MYFPNRKARTGIFVTGVVLSAAFLAACGQTSPATAPVATPKAIPAIAVSAATAQHGDIQRTLTYSGEVRASHQISVLPKASGLVQQVLIDTGATVKATVMDLSVPG